MTLPFSDIEWGQNMRKAKMILLMILVTTFLLKLNIVSADCKIVGIDVPPKVINVLADLDEAVPIKVSIRNDGDASDTYVLVFKVNGVEIRTERVKVGAGETLEHEFTHNLYGEPLRMAYPWNKDAGATYEIELNGYTATTVVTPFPDFLCTP